MGRSFPRQRAGASRLRFKTDAFWVRTDSDVAIDRVAQARTMLDNLIGREWNDAVRPPDLRWLDTGVLGEAVGADFMSRRSMASSARTSRSAKHARYPGIRY